MADTKLKVTLFGNSIEVEGSESFVRAAYDEFKKRLESAPAAASDESYKVNAAKSKKHETAKKAKSRNSTHSRKESYNIVKDLDLSAKSGKKGLREFYKEKSPSAFLQRNTVFVYYLQKISKISAITEHHIYTCYKDVNEKIPGALRQSLLDTSFRKGWIDTKAMNNITVSTQGENLVEHDLPEQKDKK